MQWVMRALLAVALVALGLSFLGMVHPVGDSLAVFRLGIAALALALLWPARPGRLPAILLLGALPLMAAGSVLWHKLPGPESGALTLYQKNMFHRNSDIAGLAADILQAAPDIVTLQEVSVENELLLDLLWQAYPAQHLCRYNRRSGVAVLTKLPLAQPEGTGRFCSADIGLAGLRVETPAGPHWALSLHLAWPWPGRQPLQLAKIDAALAQVPGPRLLGGDFNMVPWSHALRQVARATGATRAAPSVPSFSLRGVPLPIDHVFAPAGGQAVARPWLGSDHRGLFARLRLSEG
ncbi:MAG: endonuclease/exonuclease/phosphatase family protein [Roseovarius sp.]